MADVVLFHHVQGLTDGVRQLAARIAGAEHIVHTPDLYDGAVASTLEEGIAIKDRIGDAVLNERAEAAAADVQRRNPDVVYAGISLGVLFAQRLAQTRPSAAGALLYEACIPITGDWAFGPWPAGVPVQVHGMADDEFFAGEGDVDAARELVATIGEDLGELFTYPGHDHLFIDASLDTYDEAATDAVVERSRALLRRVDLASS